MSSIPTLPGINSTIVPTARLKMHLLTSGPEDGTPVLFIHGNASCSTYWEETMLALPEQYHAIAPDLRGYGDTEDKRIDARRGLGDWLDDLQALLEELGVEKYHLVGHSMGGTIAMGMIGVESEKILSTTLIDPGSIYGFGGTKDLEGTPNYADFAGSGGGTVNPDFPRLIGEDDRSTDDPQASPRVVMNSFYWKPPFKPQREEELLSGLLSEKIGPERYPGDQAPSENWPNVAPGKWGPVNAISPKYVGDSVERLLNASPKPDILWVRGDSDQIVSDNSLFDFGALGKIGAVPGWPGEEVYPPQPMVGQTRAVLSKYQNNGGAFREVVIEDTAHSPYIEKPGVFMAELIPFLEKHSE